MLKLSTTVMVCAALAAAGCHKARTSAPGGGEGIGGKLVIFHAGSLSVPLRRVSQAFQARHPGLVVEAEAAGSRDTARKVCDLHRACDVLASADYKVVANLLVPRYAKFNARFATNELAIVYAGKSKFAAEIDANNWPEVLLRPGVRFGRADGNRDPCGYRTEMLFQLAEKHFAQPGLAARLEAKDGSRFIRPKETDLLALLEAGEIDYLFIYRSVGMQHHLKVLRLGDRVNLANPALAGLYASAAVRVTGKAPGEHLTRTGEPIVYSVTIPTTAANPAAAQAYLLFLLSPEGQKIMADCGQGAIAPALADGWDDLPPALRPFCRDAAAR